MNTYSAAVFQDLFSPRPTYIVVDNRDMSRCKFIGEQNCLFRNETGDAWTPHVVIPITERLNAAEAKVLADKICEALNT